MRRKEKRREEKRREEKRREEKRREKRETRQQNKKEKRRMAGKVARFRSAVEFLVDLQHLPDIGKY